MRSAANVTKSIEQLASLCSSSGALLAAAESGARPRDYEDTYNHLDAAIRHVVAAREAMPTAAMIPAPPAEQAE